MTDEHTKTHLQIGTIARPHGVRGEFKVRLHFEGSTALFESSHVVVVPGRGEARRYIVESVRGSNKGPILALEGIVGRDAADELRGAQVWVERAALAPLEDGEYYLVDLVGCAVFLDEAQIAVVKQVRPDPSVDTMILEMKDGSTAELPIVDAWLKSVDVEAKKVELDSLDGLIQS